MYIQGQRVFRAQERIIDPPVHRKSGQINIKTRAKQESRAKQKIAPASVLLRQALFFAAGDFLGKMSQSEGTWFSFAQFPWGRR